MMIRESCRLGGSARHPLPTGRVVCLALLAHTFVLPAATPLTYFMSFSILGIFWDGQQTQLGDFARSDRNLAWIRLAFLFAVALMPYSTSLLS